MTINFDNIYKKEIITGTELSEKAPELRASNMPLCPKKFVYQYIEYLQGNATWDYLGDFFCDIGTSVHSSVQKWLPRSANALLMGNWRCDHCGKPKKTKKGVYYIKPFIVYNRIGPVRCPKCKREMLYDEFVLNVTDAPITGHCDGLLLDKDYVYTKIKDYYKTDPIKIDRTEAISLANRLIADKNLMKKLKVPAYVLELKTTSSFQIKQIREPKHEYHCQASFYASALHRILKKRFKFTNISVKGYLLKYIARDNPRLVTKDFVVKRDDEIYKVNTDLVNMFFDSFINGEYKKLYKTNPCRKWPDIYRECSYTSFCNEEINFKEFNKFCNIIKKKYKKIENVRKQREENGQKKQGKDK